MNNRLYYADSYLTEFESVVAALVTLDKRDAIVLEQSCFYPTSGGQHFDTGTLTAVGSGKVFPIVDVAVADFSNPDLSNSGLNSSDLNGADLNRTDADNGAGPPILHFIKADTSALRVGMKIHGQIDWQRRYDHMQQHSSQHLISHTLDSLLHYETVSVHFGTAESTIDVKHVTRDQGDTKSGLLTAEQLAEVERYANEVVYRNVPIMAYFVDDQELSKLPLRRPPKVTGQIRIVEISGLDYSACGGTHCHHSGELGPIKILKQERQKNHIRLTFVSGYRAIADYHQKHQISSEIGRIFSNEISQTPELVRGVLEQNKLLDKRLALQTERLLGYQASELWQNAETLGPFKMAACCIDDLEPNDAKQLASILQKYSDLIVLLVIPGKEKLTAIFAKGKDPAIHMGNLLRSTLAEFGGGGGGREDFAQGGGIPATTATDVLKAAVVQVRSSAASM